MLRILQVETGKSLEVIRSLFEEYADSLGFDLCFQNFEEELANLPGGYGPPEGCLLLARYQDHTAGCVGMKKFGGSICEMRRLYVLPGYRGLGIGRALAEAVIEQARKGGYTRMRLDMILPREAARRLYLSLGFRDIEPYRRNPIDGATFMELILA